MKFHIFIFIVLCGCSTQYNKSSSNELATQKSKYTVEYTTENHIMAWRDSVVETIKGRDFEVIDGIPVYLTRNKRNGDIIGYNFQTTEKVFKVKRSNLPNEAEYGQFNSIYIHNFDCIFIVQDYMIKLIDTSGIIKQQLVINNEADKLYKTHAIGNLNYAPIFFDAKNNKLYIESYCWKCKRHKPSYYKSKIEVAIDLASGKTELLPQTYPILYQENYYGYANHTYREANDSLNVYSFPVDPNIYLYNRLSGNYKTVGGKSKYQKQLANTLSRKQKDDEKTKIEHFSIIPFYYKVHYNPFQNYYYRFFSPGLSQKNEEGLFNKNSDREHILMIFDEQFKLIDEIKLEEKYQVFFTFCTPEGLYVNRVNEKKEKGLYTIFKINIQ